jgi:phenylalanyl-tRNA synthetase beta chain
VDLELEDWVRDILVGCGLTETIAYSMTNLESVAKLTPEKAMPDPERYLKVTNPLSRDHEYLRQTLMNTSLETLASNLRFLDRVAIFEIARVYLPQEGRMLPEEPRYLSIALSGPREARSWMAHEGGKLDYYDLKGVIETLCGRLGVREVAFTPIQHPTFHLGRVASLAAGGVQIGMLGEVHPLVRSSFGLPEQCVCLLELNLDKLLANATKTPETRPISRMPALREDLAIIVDEDVPPDRLMGAIREAGGAFLTDVVLFDVYRGEQVSAGKRSLAFSLTFQSPDRTLTSEEAAKQRERIVKRLAQEFGAQVRGE